MFLFFSVVDQNKIGVKLILKKKEKLIIIYFVEN